jgi:WD40 repeat protein
MPALRSRVEGWRDRRKDNPALTWGRRRACRSAGRRRPRAGLAQRAPPSFTGAPSFLRRRANEEEHLRLIGFADGSTVRLFDAATGKFVASSSGHGKDLTMAATSPDQKLLATASDDQVILLWDMPHLLMRREIKVSHPVTGLTFAPDGRSLILRHAEGEVVLDLGTGKEVDARPRSKTP